MRKATAVLLGVLLPLLGLAGIGQAQSAVQIQGTIESVDCQTQTLVVDTPAGANTIAASPDTPVLVNSVAVPFCSLADYTGAPVSLWLAASGGALVATQIDVVAQTVPAPVETVPVEPAPAVEAAPLTIEGVVLGTIVVGGLLYLLVNDHDHYYRYPYYGAYYHYYYHPEYRPFLGAYPAAVPIIAAPAPLAGLVLGTAVVAGLEYLITRDRGGRFYRYPYYGPYHGYYYRPEYRPYHGYQGSYHDAPVRFGEPRWNGPANAGPRAPITPGFGHPGGSPAIPQYDRRWTQPAQHAPNWNAPAYRQYNGPANGPVQHAPNWNPPAYRQYNGPANGPAQHAPSWNPPAYRQYNGPANGPAQHAPNWGGPAYHQNWQNGPVQRGPSRTSPGYRNTGNHGSNQQCGGRGGNQCGR